MTSIQEQHSDCVLEYNFQWTTIELREVNSTLTLGSLGGDGLVDGQGYLRIIPQKDDEYEYWIALSNISSFREILLKPYETTTSAFDCSAVSLESGCEICHKRLKGHIGIEINGQFRLHSRCAERVSGEVSQFTQMYSEEIFAYTI